MISALELMIVKHATLQPTETGLDVACDVCRQSARVKDYGPQFGTLQAQWGVGSMHDGKRYEVRLCEHCFFRTLSTLSRERMVNTMFVEFPDAEREEFGLVGRMNPSSDSGQ